MKTRRLLRFSSVAFLVAIISETLYPQPAKAQGFLSTWDHCQPLRARLKTALENLENQPYLERFIAANWIQDKLLEQPDWVAPLITQVSSPRVEQMLRYDQLWQANQNGAATDNFGGGKGLGGTSPAAGNAIELIPFPFDGPNTEVAIGFPAWIAHNGKPKPKTTTDGWADETFWFKQRLVCNPKNGGNSVVTALINFSAPTGTPGNSNGHGIFTPMIAAGIGSGNFDVQGNVGISLPDGGVQRLGMPVVWNTAFQWEIDDATWLRPTSWPEFETWLKPKSIWPEFEVNYTWWPNGQHEGQTQVFLTPGVIVKNITPAEVTLGVGYQVAVTANRTYNHEVVLSARIPIVPKSLREALYALSSVNNP